ncbi:RNA polymerase sigma factor [Mucilaginibacter sp. Mucisp86]|uniref:RNA polymerase sigma factor n=1 Tax=Mucilaginibacter sp. Mucisp86 TaxID=3243060 RepID=UPI0039B3EFCD
MYVLTPSAEKELLARLRQGDSKAFDQIYHHYSLKIYANILRMVKDADDAQELLQDVFLKVWQKRHNIDPEQSFKSYLFRISRNLVYNFFRDVSIERKVMDYLASIGTELHTDLEDDLMFKEQKQLLEQAINQLPPQRRQVYTLCKIEGHSYAEVSRMLGISTSTISDHIVKATRFIKEHHRLTDGAALLAVCMLFNNI